MDKKFSPEEILRIAVNIETKGEALYAAFEKQTKRKELMVIWRYLKEQEESHRKTFQDMLDHAEDFVMDDFSPGEYDAYLRAIASEYVFTQETFEKKNKDGFLSDLDAVIFAISIEKDSILTYEALKTCMMRDRQNILDRIIDEERKHLVDLSAMRIKIST